MEPLDTILSGRGEATSASPEVAEQPAQIERPEAEQVEGQQPAQTQAEPDDPDAVDVGGQKMVPHAALHAQKERVKRYTEQVAAFEQRLKDQDQAWERRFSQLLQTVGQPRQQQEQPQAPDWFENPTEAARYAVAPQFNQFEQMMHANARIVAEGRFGDDKVKAAEEAFLAAHRSGSLDPADYQRIVNSPNRYAAAVQWQQRQEALREIGDDPAAFREKVRAEVLAELQKNGGQAQQPSQQASPAPVMPSNLAAARNVGTRAGPAWSGPQSLADIFKRG